MGIFSFFKRDKPQKRYAIVDVNDDTFKQQVIQRSYKTTVVVDFWAAWCGPCRQLGPILERLAEEPDGDFILAKLNTEHNQRTAARYNIRSIPAVKAFRNGQVVNEFIGAIPESLVRRFIQKVNDSPPPEPTIKASTNPTRRLQQAEQHLKRGRGFEAFVVLNDFPVTPQQQRALKLLPLARFLFDMDDGDGLTGAEQLDNQYMAAARALKQGKPDDALDRLTAAYQVGEEIDRAYTLRVIESLFELMGNDSELTKAFRQKLDLSTSAS